MKNMSRRKFSMALMVFAAMGSLTLKGQTSMAAKTTNAETLSQSQVFSFDQMPVSKMPNGAERRNIVHGKLATGEVVELHESTQRGGTPPNTAHRIEHTEFIMVREGTML